MDRYVQFAVAAAMEAVTDAGLDLDEVDRERLAVTLGSAVGGTMVLEHEYVVVSNHGEKWLVDHEYASPVPLPRARPEHAGGRGRAQVRRPRAVRRRLHRLHLGHRRDRLRPPADPGRRGGHRHLRRLRGADLADLDGLLRPDQGDLARGTTTPSTPRGRSTATATASSWARAPRSSSSRSSSRAGARRAHLLRGRGLREPRQRVPHDRAASRRRGDGGGDPRRDGAGRDRAGGHRLHQRARLGDQAERPPRDRGVQALARRPGVQDPDQLDQVDDRPLARRRSARSRWPRARWRSTAASSRRPPTGRTPTRSATSTTRPARRGSRQIDAALSTGSGFGGFQSAMILARPKELQEVGI